MIIVPDIISIYLIIINRIEFIVKMQLNLRKATNDLIWPIISNNFPLLMFSLMSGIGIANRG